MAFYHHQALLTYSFGSQLHAGVANVAIKTHDFVTLQVPGNSQYLGVPGADEESLKVEASYGAPDAWHNNFRDTHTYFYLTSVYDDDASRPRPLRFNDPISIFPRNRHFLHCDGSTATTALDGYWWKIQSGAATGEVKAGQPVWLFATNVGKVLGVKADGSVACFEDANEGNQLIIDKPRQGAPELHIGGSTLSLSDALNSTYLQEHMPKDSTAAEAEVVVPLDDNTIGRLQTVANTTADIPRLHDTGFGLIADGSEDQSVKDESEALQLWVGGEVPTFLAIITLFWPLTLGKTWLGWTPVCVNILCRFLRLLCVAYILRVMTFLSTSVPGAVQYCQPTWNGGLEDYNHPPSSLADWSPWSDTTMFLQNCGDNIFSGHTTNGMITVMIVQAYAWALCS
eukprot:CAMPEP_0204329866 /NCGR_PEP_ID=MMETSP0469-20131031/14486_1 /ASSEMBLY_ACC=CAM_ASM_000384 /TAXON_ID=2969 /ORGANISM="Oxyrrhis marina" /LENGTH=397 /DNA_ID=CAMNT_0051312555 /DNA_START=95 /DNA_END=1285 /DNA_ORIENTATION=-